MVVKTANEHRVIQTTSYLQYLILFLYSACIGILLTIILESYHWDPNLQAQKKHQIFLDSLLQYIFPPLWDSLAQDGQGLPRLLLSPPLPEFIWSALGSYAAACRLMAAIGALGVFSLSIRLTGVQSPEANNLKHTIKLGTTGLLSSLFYVLFCTDLVSPHLGYINDSLSLLTLLAVAPWFSFLLIPTQRANRNLFIISLTFACLILTAGIPAGLCGIAVLAALTIHPLGRLVGSKRTYDPLLAILLAAAASAFYWLPLIVDGSKMQSFLSPEEWHRWGAPHWNYHQWISLRRTTVFFGLSISLIVAAGLYRKRGLLLTLSLSALSLVLLVPTKFYFLTSLSLAILGITGAMVLSKGIARIFKVFALTPSPPSRLASTSWTVPWSVSTAGGMLIFVVFSFLPTFAAVETQHDNLISAIQKPPLQTSKPPVEQIKGRSDMNCIWTGPTGFQCNIFVIHKSSFRFLMTDYPQWQLTLDGKPQNSIRDPKSGRFMIELTPGPHSVNWILADSLARAVGKWISIVALGLLFAGAMLNALIQKPQPIVTPT